MGSYLCRLIFWLFSLLFFVVSPLGMVVFSADFLSDYANPLLTKWWPGDEAAWNFSDAIDQNAKIIDNIKNLFFPTENPSNNGWLLRVFLRTVGVAVFFALLVWAWVKFILNADNPEETKKTQRSLLYILFGAAIFFLSRWILSSLLDLSTIEGLYEEGGMNDFTAVSKADDLMLFVLAFLKGIAFFVAIFFLVRYGYEFMIAVWGEEKSKAAQKWIINVLLALIFIKVIDYLYYIALGGNFKDDAIEFIVQASKFITYILWAAFLFALLYAGYLMLTAWGSEENTTKAKNILKAVFIIALLVLLFLLIIFQIFKDIV